MTEALPLAEVKAHLSELVGRVHKQHDSVTVTVHGRPSAVMISIADLEALEQTIAVLSKQRRFASCANPTPSSPVEKARPPSS